MKKSNRRQFLKSATGVAAGAISFPYYVSASALGNDGAVAASNRIVMGAIGVGSQGGGDMRGFMSKKAAMSTRRIVTEPRDAWTINTATPTAGRTWISGT